MPSACRSRYSRGAMSSPLRRFSPRSVNGPRQTPDQDRRARTTPRRRQVVQRVARHRLEAEIERRQHPLRVGHQGQRQRGKIDNQPPEALLALAPPASKGLQLGVGGGDLSDLQRRHGAAVKW